MKPMSLYTLLAGRNVHVVWRGEWMLERENVDCTLRVANSRKYKTGIIGATTAAKRIASREGVDVIIHDRFGHIVERICYSASIDHDVRNVFDAGGYRYWDVVHRASGRTIARCPERKNAIRIANLLDGV